MRYVISVFLMAAVLAAAPSAFAEGFSFRTTATGDQEIQPPGGVITRTTGTLRLDFDAGLTEADFDLRVRRGRAITQAHLHCARAGVNGPIVAFLFDVAPIPGPGGVDVNGRLVRGTLTNADIEDGDFAANPNCGVVINNIASLLEAILKRSIYLNVHSEANPPGEIRGQIFPDGNDDSDKDSDD